MQTPRHRGSSDSSSNRTSAKNDDKALFQGTQHPTLPHAILIALTCSSELGRVYVALGRRKRPAASPQSEARLACAFRAPRFEDRCTFCTAAQRNSLRPKGTHRHRLPSYPRPCAVGPNACQALTMALHPTHLRSSRSSPLWPGPSRLPRCILGCKVFHCSSCTLLVMKGCRYRSAAAGGAGRGGARGESTTEPRGPMHRPLL